MNHKILTKFIKDISFEVPDVETFLFFEENINKYELAVDIISKPLKKGMIQVDLILKFIDKTTSQKKAHVEITFSSIIKIEGKLDDKEELKKLLLIKVPTEIYPDAFSVFSFLLEKSGLKNVKTQKQVDFEALYNQKK